VRFLEEDFIELELRPDVSINGITGKISRPYLGQIKVDEEEIWENVLLASNMNYNIDSEYQLVEVNGWIKDL
jgi:predicted PolB exonuclease-like 3'-5' exonuclease